MSYTLKFSKTADRQLASFPEPLRSFAAKSLRALAESPSVHRLRNPGTSRGQRADFAFKRGGADIWVIITFFYGQDEQTLHIQQIFTEFGG